MKNRIFEKCYKGPLAVKAPTQPSAGVGGGGSGRRLEGVKPSMNTNALTPCPTQNRHFSTRGIGGSQVVPNLVFTLVSLHRFQHVGFVADKCIRETQNIF